METKLKASEQKAVKLEKETDANKHLMEKLRFENEELKDRIKLLAKQVYFKTMH